MKMIRFNTFEFLTCKQFTRFLTVFLSGLFILGACITAIAQSAERKVSENAFAGEWMAEMKPNNMDKIDVKFKRQFTTKGFSSTSNPFLLAELQDLALHTALSSEKRAVNFRIVREAGTFECEGYMQNGKGTGLWKLFISRDFISSMRTRGYDNLTENDLFDAALQNINGGLIEDLRSAGYDNLSFKDLVEARIFNITPQFIQEQKFAGYQKLTFKELVEIRLFNRISSKSP
jgi:hypothetical protein